MMQNAQPPLRSNDLLGIARGAQFQRLVRRRLRCPSGLFDDRGHRIRLRHLDRVTARNLVDRRTGALGHEALGRWRNHRVFGDHQVPARLGLPSRLTDRAAQRLGTRRDPPAFAPVISSASFNLYRLDVAEPFGASAWNKVLAHLAMVSATCTSSPAYMWSAP
jgi:hypothetical protein